MDSKKFLLIFVSTVLTLVAVSVGINVYVNPYGYYGDKVLGDEKVFNAQIAKYDYLNSLAEKPNAFVLGSSNAMRMKPSTIDSLFKVKSFNFGVYQASIEDFYCISNVLLNDLKVRPELMIICVDDWNFGTYSMGKDVVFKGAQNRLAYKPQFSGYLKDFNWLKLYWGRFKTGLAFEQLAVSITNLKTAYLTGNFKRHFLNMEGAFYKDGTRISYGNNQGDNITEIAEKGDYDILSYLKKEHAAALKKNKEGSFKGTHEDIQKLEPERLQLLEQLVILLEKSNVKIIFNVMPVHPFYQELSDRYSNYSERMGQLVTKLKELKMKHPNIILVKDNHDIKNFNGISCHFFDHIHPTSTNSDSMLFSIKRELKTNAF